MAMAETSTTFDPAALIRSHQAGVWRYLRSLGCDPTVADDLTQETFLWVLQKPIQDYNQQATAAYLRKVARSLFVSALRRRDRNVADEQLDALDDVWVRWGERDGGQTMMEALRECFQTLDERAQRALDLRFRERQSRANIATALALSEDGAKNLMQRSKKLLRECIQRKLGTT